MTMKKKKHTCTPIIMKEKKKEHTPIYLPHDLVENILCRLPMKPLLRFKAVCKQWAATISDLHQTKNSSFSSFLDPCGDEVRRLTLENNKFREVSPFEYPPPLVKKLRRTAWSYCNGLFLISINNRKADYVLWNPSRGTYKELHYPYPYDFKSRPRLHGICYNPSMKDYRVVIIHAEHYAVYSCKNKSWSEMRTIEISIREFVSTYTNDFHFNFRDVKSIHYHYAGVPHDESIYWLMYSDGQTDLPKSRIICFDGRDEKLRIVCNLDNADRGDLFSSRDSLYLIPIGYSWEKRKVYRKKKEIVIKKILPICKEIKVKKFVHFGLVNPKCFTQENKIIIFRQVFSPMHYLLYDFTQRCYAETSQFIRFYNYRIFPYIENSFLF